MWRKTLAGLAAAAILLTGCSEIAQGTVVDKDYDAAYTEMKRGENCTTFTNGTGTTATKQRICTPYTTPVYHAEEYELRLKNSREEGWREVSASEYDKYDVGDQYP